MKKVLMIFCVFVGLFSVSNATEFTTSGVKNTAVTSSKTKLQLFTEYAGYTLKQIISIFDNKDSSDGELGLYETMISALDSAGYNILYWKNKVNSRTEFAIWEKSQQNDIGKYVSNDYLHISSTVNTDDKFVVVVFNRVVYEHLAYEFTITSEGIFQLNYQDYSKEITGINASVKELTLSSGYLLWDGESYYYQSSNTPSSNYDLANIISIIKSSTEIQDNVYSYLGDYFIVPDGTIDGEEIYEIYFYHKSVNLSQFEYAYNDTLYYDLDKTSINGVISNLTYYLGGNTSSNVIKDVQLFTLYYNPETNTGDIYFTSNRTLNELKSFVSETQPIIYTTKNIAYYSATWGETDTEWTATADTSKDVLYTEIQDSDGNIISPVVDNTTSSLSETPWNRFISAIKNIPSQILSGLKTLFVPDLSYLNGTIDNLKTKLNFISQAKNIVKDITNSIELNPTAPPSLTIDLTNANSKYNWGTEAICLDLSWYAPFKPAVDFLIICFCYGYFAWNLFRKLPDIINGVAGSELPYQVERVSNNSKREAIGFRTK